LTAINHSELQLADYQLRKDCSTEENIAPPKMIKDKPSKQCKEPFIMGPLPVSWLVCASYLPGHAMQVGLALWFWKGVLKTNTFRLNSWRCEGFGVISKNCEFVRYGITRSTKARALRILEQAGLITVKGDKNKAPEVTINTL
jgi:hypothetical protein